MNQDLQETLKTSADWDLESEYIILDPDGWDRQNYQYSWYEEKITKEEFDRRLFESTVGGRKKKPVDIAKKAPLIAKAHELMRENPSFHHAIYASATARGYRKWQCQIYDIACHDTVFKEKLRPIMLNTPCGWAWEIWSIAKGCYPSFLKDVDCEIGVPVGVIDEWLVEALNTFKK